MNGDDLQRKLDDIFDQGLIFHGFTDYMRDYELVVHCTADPRTGIPPANLRYLFKVCVVARIETSVPPEVWLRSLDERLIDYEAGVDLDGYVWGVKWQMLYPGARIVRNSVEARRWTDALAIPFHEVEIEGNGHRMTLVFSDLEVTEVEAGFAPFVVGPGGPDGKIPLG